MPRSLRLLTIDAKLGKPPESSEKSKGIAGPIHSAGVSSNQEKTRSSTHGMSSAAGAKKVIPIFLPIRQKSAVHLVPFVSISLKEDELIKKKMSSPVCLVP